MFLGFTVQGLDWQKTMHHLGLFWNILSSWIVSAWWCSGPISWSVLMVMVLTLVALSANIFSLGGQRWRSAITSFGACVSYSGKYPGWFGHFETALIRRLSAAPGPAPGEEAPSGNTTAGKEEEEAAISEGEIWACVTAVLVMLMVVCLDVLLRCHRLRGNRVIAATDGTNTAPTALAADTFVGVVPKPIVVAQLDDPQTLAVGVPAVAVLPSAAS